MSVKLNYVGHSCFGINADGDYILIDPFISGNPRAKVTFDLNKVKYIFVTHGHSDHLGDAINISKSTGAVIVCIFELANYCMQRGAKAMGVGVGANLKFDFGNVRFLPAIHTSSTPDGAYAGIAASLLFELDGVKVYHAGDTALSAEMKTIGELYKPDVALLPVGGQYTMDIEDAAVAAKWLRAPKIIPMHYNTFDLVKADIREFGNLVEYEDRECTEMQPGSEIELTYG